MKRHVVFHQGCLWWGGFGAALLSLLVLLGLQYRSLTALEEMSAAAHKGMLKNALDAVALAVEQFYRSEAERTLSALTAKATLSEPVSPAAAMFFIALFQDLKTPPQVSWYHPSGAAVSPDPTVVQAVQVVLAPWQQLQVHDSARLAGKLLVDEHDPEHRMIFKLHTNAAGQLISVAGMLVDLAFFRTQYLPAVIETQMAAFCSAAARNNANIMLTDQEGRLQWALEATTSQDTEVERPLQFVFTDWRLGIQNRYVTPEQWARWHFVLNVLWSLVAAGGLLGGMMLALRTTMRDVQLSQLKTDFVSNVSHELRTPVASMRVFGELLRLGRVTDPAQIRLYGAHIETASQRLTQLINNILDFSRMESGQKMFTLHPTDISAVIAETLRSFETRQHEHTLVYQAPAEPLPQLALDAEAVAQAVTNLLDNAIKYSLRPGEISLCLGRREGYVTLTVRDQGIGIPRQEHERIFERFYRLGTGLVHDVKGSGLGLALVQHIVASHGGYVTVESHPGQGSAFTLHFPIPMPETERDLGQAWPQKLQDGLYEATAPRGR